MPQPSPRRIIHPDGRVARTVRATVLIASLWSLVVEPFMLAMAHFDHPWRDRAPGGLVALSTLADLALLANAVAGPCKGFRCLSPSDGLQLEMRFEATWREYVRSGAMLLDALSAVVPVQLVLWAASHSPERVDALVVLSLFKLLHLARVLAELDALAASDVERRRAAGAARIVLVFVVAVHWLACLWLLVVAQSLVPYLRTLTPPGQHTPLDPLQCSAATVE